MKKHRRALPLALTAVLLFSTLAVLDSKYRLQLSVYEIPSAALPAAFDGFRIVHLTDLHGARFGPENRTLIRRVREQAPDLIALTGDFASDPSELAAVEELLEGLEGLAPIFYVSGNHEWAGGCMAETRALMEAHGVTCLANEYRPLSREGERIVVAGVDDPNGWADMLRPDGLAERLRAEYPGDFVLLLGHRNYWVQKYPALPVDLILCGHAHGGIVRLPFVGGLLDVSHKFGAEYEAGLYPSGDYVMEVSRGLGNSIPVPRLFNRPEIVTLILRSEQA